MVRPFSQCLARPSSPGQSALLLSRHLEAVALGCGDPKGSYEDRLAFLAGLSHDAIKATEAWQYYIRGGSAKGPPHAPAGAALFAFWAEDLIPKWTCEPNELARLHDLALDWVRVIHRHHGTFDDVTGCLPWDNSAIPLEHEPSSLLAGCDCASLDTFVREHFPEMQTTLDRFPSWCEQFDDTWRYRQETVRSGFCSKSQREGTIEHLGLRVAELGARLIYADRRHAAEWQPTFWTPSQAEEALHRFGAYCRGEIDKACRNEVSGKLLQARLEKQVEALETYRNHESSHLFTLLLPTGYGKTLTGLRVALEAVRSGRCKRLLYVAPYISILSQAARVLEKATGQWTVLHHQMSILNFGDPKPGRDDSSTEDVQREDHQPYDLLDTWQAPIVATTFNQFFRALFPTRAQECLRISALDGAFVFIDEPQIIDPIVWSAFVRALAVISRQRQFQVLFCTATLPPLEDGLGDHGVAVPLVKPFKPDVSRFVIRAAHEPWTADRVASEAQSRLRSQASVAVIMNTVRDAVDVFCRLKKLGGCWLFLASRMLPGHKEQKIRRIRRQLKDPSRPIGVVCTQILEAGVNLSFRFVLRACPVFTSIVQAAGRANRHGEGAPAEVLVFPYIREDGRDSRRWVYRDNMANDQTNSILETSPIISEEEVSNWLEQYYQNCWGANPHTTSLQAFEKAAMGQWSKLAELAPFQEDLSGLDVFVPGAERYLSKPYLSRLQTFGVQTAGQFLELYLDRQARRNLSFRDRRLQSALLRQFMVDAPKSVADKIAFPLAGSEWPLVLDNSKLYRASTGLAHLLVENDQDGKTRVC